MPHDIPNGSRPTSWLDSVLAEIEQAREQGRTIDVRHYLDRYPDLTKPLSDYFRDYEWFARVAPRLAPTATYPGSPLPQPGLPLGSRIGGYEVVQEVGHGGRGIVYRVSDPELNRPLAVKVLRPELLDEPGAVRRFLEEAQVTGQLQHPGIVPVHAIGRLPDGRPYLVMKLVQGRTLAELLAERPAPGHDLPRFLGIFNQVCEAVAYAHSRGVIHRDLKPANVMVGAFAEVQVMDWGLAKVLMSDRACRELARGEPGAPAASSNDTIRTVRTEATGLSSTDGLVVGTFAYMSPEQALGRLDQLGPASDVYGLGAILYALLTGRPPIEGEDAAEVLRKAQRGEWLPPRRVRADVPAALDAICRKTLAPRPEQRYATALELAADVGRWLTDEPVTAYAEPWLERSRRRMRRHRALVSTAVGVLVVALLGTTVGLVAVQQAYEGVKRDYKAEQRQHAIDRALTAAMGGQLEGAEWAVEEAEWAGASAGQVHMLRGQIALHRGQSRDARQHLEEAVRLLPDNVSAWGMLAAAYADDGDWERYDKAVRQMERLTPQTPEDFLFKGYAEAYLEPEQGLRTIKQTLDRRPMMGIALLLRAEVRAFVAQDNDNLDEAEGALLDAGYARELLRDNPTALWVSLEAHLAKAGVHEHRDEPDERRAELDLAGKDADALKPCTALPEAVVYRWTYLREEGREKEVLDELRRASKETEHVYANFCCALTLYWHGDFEEALRVLEHRPGTSNDRLLPFVLAEHDYHSGKQDWQARARKAYMDFAGRTQDGVAVMEAHGVLCLLGAKEVAVKASKALLERPEQFYSLRRDPFLRCLRYNAGELSADELLQGAGSSKWDQCLAHYNIAMTKLAEGDRNAALDHFDKAVKTRASGWAEYDMSWVFRARLKNDPTWPPWIPQQRAQ
jgi:serine/threonine protein kinase/predicted Zn-dependent protease